METKPLSAMPKLKTNLDTDFLKLIAILSMVIDMWAPPFSGVPRLSMGGAAGLPHLRLLSDSGSAVHPRHQEIPPAAGGLRPDFPALLHLCLSPLGLASGVDEYEHLFHAAGKPASPVGSPYQTVVLFLALFLWPSFDILITPPTASC